MKAYQNIRLQAYPDVDDIQTQGRKSAKGNVKWRMRRALKRRNRNLTPTR